MSETELIVRAAAALHGFEVFIMAPDNLNGYSFFKKTTHHLREGVDLIQIEGPRNIARAKGWARAMEILCDKEQVRILKLEPPF